MLLFCWKGASAASWLEILSNAGRNSRKITMKTIINILLSNPSEKGKTTASLWIILKIKNQAEANIIVFIVELPINTEPILTKGIMMIRSSSRRINLFELSMLKLNIQGRTF